MHTTHITFRLLFGLLFVCMPQTYISASSRQTKTSGAKPPKLTSSTDDTSDTDIIYGPVTTEKSLGRVRIAVDENGMVYWHFWSKYRISLYERKYTLTIRLFDQENNELCSCEFIVTDPHMHLSISQQYYNHFTSNHQLDNKSLAAKIKSHTVEITSEKEGPNIVIATTKDVIKALGSFFAGMLSWKFILIAVGTAVLISYSKLLISYRKVKSEQK